MIMELVVAIAVLLAVLLFFLRGAPELARLEVRDGALEFTKGRMPQKLLDDFGDVLKGSSAPRAVVRVVLDGGQPRVVATGLSEAELQGLRNVAGLYSAAQFRSGRAPRQ
jgi:hypothetical protein